MEIHLDNKLHLWSEWRKKIRDEENGKQKRNPFVAEKEKYGIPMDVIQCWQRTNYKAFSTSEKYKSYIAKAKIGCTVDGIVYAGKKSKKKMKKISLKIPHLKTSHFHKFTTEFIYPSVIKRRYVCSVLYFFWIVEAICREKEYS